MIWNIYFFIIFYLYACGNVRFEFWPNLALFAFVLMPQSKKHYGRVVRVGQVLIGGVAAIILAWRESWLPPIQTLIHFLIVPAMRPSRLYVLEFLRGYINVVDIFAVTAIIVVAITARAKKIWLTPLVIVGIFCVPIINTGSQMAGGSQNRLGANLQAFYHEEAKRVVSFNDVGKPKFDIIIIHVCSLSWDDLRTAGIDGNKFFSQFDYVFTHFNSATSYSNPAAYRLLLMPCGQTSHADLYNLARPRCYILDDLRKEGYKTFTVLNHGGHYGHFASGIMKNGHADKRMGLSGLTVAEIDFANDPVYDDLTVLKKWWKNRLVSKASKAVLYYNSITLHAGSHFPGQKDWWRQDPVVHYRLLASRFFDEINQFLALIQASGKNVVVIFVPEHGAALKGYPIQARDLRDIPLPQITMVPVAVKILGLGHEKFVSGANVIKKPMSYLALAELLLRFVKRPPFTKGAATDLKSVIASLPETTFWAETQNFIVGKSGAHWTIYQHKTNSWSALPSGDVPLLIGGGGL
jgi:cellulose synthase operon protein YhjU